MGPNGSENSKRYTNHSQKFSNFSWIFFPMVLTKLRLGFLKFWKLNFNDFFFVFLNMGHYYGSQDFQTLLLLRIAAESFQNFSEYSSQRASQKYVWNVCNFENWNFNQLYSFSLTWDPMGAKISKRYSSLKSVLNHFKLFLNFLLSGPHKSAILNFWNFEFPVFNDFFNFTIVPYGETKNFNYLENERP